MASDNKTLGRFQLGGIPLASRGVPQIEVAFDIDANGIVNVSAKDLGTGKSQSVTIQSGTSLSEAEIKKMVREAEENAESDKLLKEEADLKNECEQIIFAAKKSVSDLGEEVTEQEKKDIEEKSKDLEAALKGKDLEDIKKKKEKLLKISQNVAARAYEKAQKENEAHSSPPNGESDSSDDAVDAEYEDSSN